uniref:F-box domain-containing protein n=1 Tax=Bionectria ochroleuca TaxID=29856 RepID=A0A8H7N2K6_BIOOC
MYPDSLLGHLLYRPPCCAICNSSFQTNSTSNTWQKQYRVLYCDDGCCTSFSGLGIREAHLEGRWFVPKEYNESKIYSASTSHPRHESISVESEKVEDMSAQCGYIAHETCWRVLERMYAPRQVPWTCLWNTLASLQGLLSMQRLQGYDRVALGRAATVHFSQELEILMNQEPQIPPATVTEITPPEVSIDGFTCLPVELRLLIVDLLDISDALKLRQSSKAFAFIFYSQTFWGQRFASGHERAWVFGFSDQRPLSLPDWRSLYKLTGSSCTPGLRRMKYLWPFLRNLQDVVPNEPISSFAEDAVCDCEWNWLYLPRFFRHSWEVSYRQMVHLPTPMVAMRVHFVKYCKQSIVAGIAFKTACGVTKTIGYSTSWSKAVQFEEDPIGFDFELTGDGIVDIQASYADNAESLSGWPADDEDVARDRLSLLISGRIGGVEGIFDGFRLLELKLAGIED